MTDAVVPALYEALQGEPDDTAGGLTFVPGPRGGRLRPYVVVGGRAVVDGDLVVGTPDDARRALLQWAVLQTANARASDLRKLGYSDEVLRTVDLLRSHVDPGSVLEGVGSPESLWPDATVRYEIRDSAVRDVVVAAMRHWTERTSAGGVRGVTFEEDATSSDRVVFVISYEGCASSGVGYTGNGQTVMVDLRYAVGSVVHEIGHVLGLWHEQVRADRDRHVRIAWDNVMPRYVGQFAQHVDEATDLGDYDYGSIMHYPPAAFAIDGARPTIVPLEAGVTIGQRTALSDGDVKAVRKLYALT